MSDRIRGGVFADSAEVEVFSGAGAEGNELGEGVVELVIGDNADAFVVTGTPSQLRRLAGDVIETLNAAGVSRPGDER